MFLKMSCFEGTVLKGLFLNNDSGLKGQVVMVCSNGGVL